MPVLSPPTARFTGLWLILLIAIAAFIRVDGANLYHYSQDETMEVDISSGKNLHEVLEFAYDGALHPPLGYVIRHYWLKWSDDKDFVRALSLLFGLALIPLYYAIGRKLKDDFTGICMATLVTFSHGAIVQSYLVRNYSEVACLLSFAFYFYIQWRASGTSHCLAAYALCSCIAGCIGFSALFFTASIMLYECIESWQHKVTIRRQAPWIAANIIQALPALLCWVWLAPRVAPIQSYLHSMLPPHLWMYSPLFPITAFAYILPYRDYAGYSTLSFLVFFTLMLFAYRRETSFHFTFLLLLSALGVGCAVFATTLFPFMGTRHIMWLLPFIITACGFALASFLDALGYHYRIKSRLFYYTIIPLLLLVGSATYSAQERFNERTEYPLHESEWEHMIVLLKQLPPDDLIIGNKGDVIELNPPEHNPYYDTIGHDLPPPLAFIPYYHTHILYDPRRGKPDNDLFFNLIMLADKQGLLASVDKFTFVVLSGSAPLSEPLFRLMTCSAIPKTLETIPALPIGHDFTHTDFMQASVVMLTVSKSDFFKAMQPGNTHTCPETETSTGR